MKKIHKLLCLMFCLAFSLTLFSCATFSFAAIGDFFTGSTEKSYDLVQLRVKKDWNCTKVADSGFDEYVWLNKGISNLPWIDIALTEDLVDDKDLPLLVSIAAKRYLHNTFESDGAEYKIAFRKSYESFMNRKGSGAEYYIENKLDSEEKFLFNYFVFKCKKLNKVVFVTVSAKESDYKKINSMLKTLKLAGE